MVDLIQNEYDNFKLIQESENDSYYQLRFSFKYTNTTKVSTKKLFSYIHDADTIDVEFLNESDDLIDKINSYEELNLEDEPMEEILFVNLKISKNQSEYRKIYSIEAWYKFLAGLPLNKLLLFFNKTEINKYFIIHSSKELTLKTSGIIITSDIGKLDSFNNEVKENIYSKISQSIRLNEDILIVPEYFNPLVCENMEKIENLFFKLRNLLSIMYVANSYQMTDDRVSVIIEGFTYFEESIRLFQDDLQLMEYYAIYSWCYENNNIIDKLGIIRTVLSYNKPLSIDEKIFRSILSNYNIYLKENVNKYLEAKEKIMQNSLEINGYIKTLLSNFNDEFKRIAFVIFTFFISVFIIGVIMTGQLKEIFIGHISTLSYVILILSTGYMFTTFINYKAKLKQIIKDYYAYKISYRDILEKKDIKILFHNDKTLRNSLIFIKKEVKNIIFFFIVGIIMLFFMILFLSRSNINSEIKIIDIDSDIIKVQILLNDQLNGEKLKIDGILGIETKNKIREYQKEHNLEIDGEISSTLLENLENN